MFATGYSFRDPPEVLSLAEPFPEAPTVGRLAGLERGDRRGDRGRVPRARGEGVFNAAASSPAGAARHSYRKIHLFGFEPEVFEPGDGGLALVEHEGFRVGVMICFDWIFPEVARALALAGADAIAHPSNLVLPFCQQAMPVRALENGVYTLTANRVGREHRPPRPALRFTGESLVVSPRGRSSPARGARARKSSSPRRTPRSRGTRRWPPGTTGWRSAGRSTTGPGWWALRVGP